MKSTTRDLLLYGSVILSIFGICIFFLASMPSIDKNYCTDTPEGKAVISRMNARYEPYVQSLKWNDEVAVQSAIQDIDHVRIWASENTTGDEQKAWLCWSDYFTKEYTDRFKLLHAQNTVKSPP